MKLKEKIFPPRPDVVPSELDSKLNNDILYLVITVIITLISTMLVKNLYMLLFGVICFIILFGFFTYNRYIIYSKKYLLVNGVCDIIEKNLIRKSMEIEIVTLPENIRYSITVPDKKTKFRKGCYVNIYVVNTNSIYEKDNIYHIPNPFHYAICKGENYPITK